MMDEQRSEFAESAARFIPGALNSDQSQAELCRIKADQTASVADVTQWAARECGWQIVPDAKHIRMYRGDASAIGIAIVHKIEHGDGELLVYAMRGLIGRSVERFLSGWIFSPGGLDLRRVTARVRSTDRKTCDYLQRLGFKCEGAIRRGFSGDEDVLIFGLLAAESRWRHPSWEK